MAQFIENLRGINKDFSPLVSTLQGRRPQGEQVAPSGRTIFENLPNADASRNSSDWQNRIAIPFSVKQKGRKVYGLFYMPEEAAARTFEGGASGKDYNKTTFETYGGETMDGLSLTTEGLNRMLSNADKNSFRIENKLVDYLGGASGGIYTTSGADTEYRPVKGRLVKTVTNIPGVRVSDTQSMRALQQNLGSSQMDRSNKNTRTTDNFLEYFRATRGRNQ